MNKREWLPQEYQDAVIPKLRATPEDWLVQMDDGNWAIAPADAYDEAPALLPLEEGEVIGFDYCIDLGKGTMSVGGLGEEYDVTSDFPEPIAPPGTYLSIWDGETPHPSLDEAAQELGIGEHAIAAVAWSNRTVRYQFTAGRLVLLAEG